MSAAERQAIVAQQAQQAEERRELAEAERREAAAWDELQASFAAVLAGAAVKVGWSTPWACVWRVGWGWAAIPVSHFAGK